MNKIPNKTKLRVGDSVYHQDLGTYHVKAVTPLSNRVVYVVLEHSTRNNEHFDCTMENTAGAKHMKALGFEFTAPFFTSYEIAQRAHQRSLQDDRHRSIGLHLQTILEILNEKG